MADTQPTGHEGLGSRLEVRRRIAIGDVHGADVALARLLNALDLQPDDVLIQLGDVIDRGPNSRRCVDLLMQATRYCRVVPLKGNHEEMMFLARRGQIRETRWLGFGGQETLDSYGGTWESIPEKHWRFYESMEDYYISGQEIFVHAAVEANVPMEKQSGERLRWRKLTGQEEALSDGKRVICGHTAQRTGIPKVWPGWVCLDTAVYATGWLTALDLSTSTLIQCSQYDAAVRRAPLDRPELLAETT